MPRSTSRSKARNGNNLTSCVASKKLREPKNCVRKEECIKKVFVPNIAKETVVEEVFHRKSERRRIARDIFLVFEEEPNCRRKTRASKKQSKPKFAHLKVDDPIRPKGLLRDIKNEPKCYLNSNSSFNPTLTHDAILKSNSNALGVKKKEKTIKPQKISASICKTGRSNNSKNIKSIKISTLESQACTLGNETKIVAKINPIFLWVKQDDTRIVEVRCEDYDKRNRIRITKTSNGWRAIPRSDPTTSRVLKFYPTPLMKVKRERNVYETNDVSSISENNGHVPHKDFLTPNILPESISTKIDAKLNGIDTVCNPLAINVKSKTKEANKRGKKKPHSGKAITKSKPSNTAERSTIINTESSTTSLAPNFSIRSSELQDFPIQTNAEIVSSVNKKVAPEINLYTSELDKHFLANSFKNNTEDFETNVDTSSIIDGPAVTDAVYHKKSESFHLCPKTGLFLPNHDSFSAFEIELNKSMDAQNTAMAATISFLNPRKEEFQIEKINGEPKIHIADDNTESLEAKTKNLKDLLDDADLLQNCDDNANSDAELIDTLVKTSCENNLIQANEVIKATSEKSVHETNEIVVQLISDVSDPPKCLSFNEAGEIEGLNGELFQSHTYIETFDKQSSSLLTEPQVMLHSTSSVTETSTLSRKKTCENIELIDEVDFNNSKLPFVAEIEDSPKDLSYKKREEVCPPSESRSQCAVTSSSDVIKSPQIEESSSIASSSETLKNLILEQFIKLNALTTQSQREPKELEKQRHSDISNMNTLYTSKSAQSSDFIETVIIEDDENDTEIESEEPLKKRIRLNKHNAVNQKLDNLSMIDKDPDPLTQLRLLIRNTQWKVPDPILVPKDRLNAVLASPAREIPLLITTRPELRLPEAFAYPEIIQNPNILVISMAQLEAILTNELEVENSTTFNPMERDAKQQFSGERLDYQVTNQFKGLKSQSTIEHLQHTSMNSKNILTTTNTIQDPNNMTTDHTDISETLSERRQEYKKKSHTDLPHTSDLNSAAMAVLNQMLWLPYFGQISQDIEKSIKNPIAFQEKCANTGPYFNTQINGAYMEGIFKNTANSKMTGQSISCAGLQRFQQQFKTNEELLLFQQIVQHQVQSVLQLNQLKSDASQVIEPVVTTNAFPSIEKSKPKIESLSNLMEQKKHKVLFSNKEKNIHVCKNQAVNCGNNISLLEKSYNLRSSVAGRLSVESKQYSNNNQRQITDNKPRLTCKSLCNLLDPEHNMVPSSSSSIPYVQNLSSNVRRSVNEIKRSSTECKANSSIAEDNDPILSNASVVSPSSRSCNNMNISIETNSELAKKRDKRFDNNSSNNDANVLTSDTNTPLWHPLFGR